jgi:hypothetical protein
MSEDPIAAFLRTMAKARAEMEAKQFKSAFFLFEVAYKRATMIQDEVFDEMRKAIYALEAETKDAP